MSQAVLDWSFGMASLGSHQATVASGHAFTETDFRPDLAAIRVPALVIHGDADKTVPIKNSGERMSQHLAHATYIAYAGAPHGLFITEKDKFNRDLIDFATGTEVRADQHSYYFPGFSNKAPALLAVPGLRLLKKGSGCRAWSALMDMAQWPADT